MECRKVGDKVCVEGTALQIAKRGGTIVVLGNFAKPVELDFRLMMNGTDISKMTVCSKAIHRRSML